MGTFQAAKTKRMNYLAHTNESFVERFLSSLFPVELPKFVETPGEIQLFEEQGSCGRAQFKTYRDAIDRHWREGKTT